MRKILGWGILALLALAYALPAHAEVKWTWETIPFRTSAANVNGYIDSSSFSAVGVAGTTYNSDTTAWISLNDYAKPPNSAPTPDSVYFVVVIHPPPGLTAEAADSMYVRAEVSATGQWATRGQYVEPMNLGGTQVGLATSMAAVLLEDQGSLNTFRGFVHMAAVNVGSLGSGAVSYVNLFGAPFVRLIVYRDAIGPFVMRIGHWAYN